MHDFVHEAHGFSAVWAAKVGELDDLDLARRIAFAHRRLRLGKVLLGLARLGGKTFLEHGENVDGGEAFFRHARAAKRATLAFAAARFLRQAAAGASAGNCTGKAPG